MNVKNLRKSKEWTKLRVRLWLEREHFCYICGHEILEEGSLSPLSYELDHLLPADKFPELFFDEDNLSLSHQICNKKKNNRTLTPEIAQQCQKVVEEILKERASENLTEEDSLYSGIIGSYDFF